MTSRYEKVALFANLLSNYAIAGSILYFVLDDDAGSLDRVLALAVVVTIYYLVRRGITVNVNQVCCCPIDDGDDGEEDEIETVVFPRVVPEQSDDMRVKN